MQLHAITTSQQIVDNAKRSLSFSPPVRAPERPEHQMKPPAPHLVEFFNRTGRSTVYSTGIYVDKRV
ncbi:MAG: hypothetical protein KatS3mg038_3762 [Candidatus Kapaibacterium sp.]|nr:MAG: hypothetical protein KatS3mg038_3595 [Candidatus Kapabacteria bacterium]GIV53241.1 MAG: hypothetical protein KatS3mg038_3762 [Candidatus Kapabacteria bacterium]